MCFPLLQILALLAYPTLASLPPNTYPTSPYTTGTLAPSFTFNSTSGVELSDKNVPLPLLLFKYNSTDPFQTQMLTCSSLDGFFEDLGESSYLFSGWSSEDMELIEGKLRGHPKYNSNREQIFFAEVSIVVVLFSSFTKALSLDPT